MLHEAIGATIDVVAAREQAMCFDLDSRPPIAPISGGALDGERIILDSADRARFTAFRVRPTNPSGAAIVILPDVRGLHPFYEELAARFAEYGVDAIAIDYFGRTAGVAPRPADFEFTPHVSRTTMAGLGADIAAATSSIRAPAAGRPGPDRVYIVGFCFGGRLALVAATLGLGFEGAVGFYGVPVGPIRNDMPAPVDVADRMGGRVLALYGGADPGIPADAVEALERALAGAGVEHRVITYPGAPHSFFDRKADEFADASASAWSEVLAFVGVA